MGHPKGAERGKRFAAGALVFLAGCTTKEPTNETYFDRTIFPIVQDSCGSTNTAANCHSMQPKGNAIGNLSVDSYEDLIKRRDLLVTYGPYNLANFLLKNVDPFDLVVTAYDGTKIPVQTDIRHSGVRTIGLTSAGFHTLKSWIESGANKNNAISPPAVLPRDDCTNVFPGDPAFDPNVAPSAPDFATFKDSVLPIIGTQCAAGNCHGSPTNSLRLACSKSFMDVDAVARWDYFVATRFLSGPMGDLANSELLRRPLDPAAGGAYHEGGVVFPSRDDAGYTAISNWIQEHGPNTNFPTSRGFDFFAKRVQPMLVKKGCMVLGCHSPAMFHDYRLRPGSGGNFSVGSTLTNYELTRNQIAPESPDPGASRLIAKNLLRPDQMPVGQEQLGRGILHRGGALLDDFAGVPTASPTLCTDTAAIETGPLDDQHAYCVIARWIQIEREDAKLTPFSGIVFVKRAPIPAPDLPQDFDKYAGSSDLCFTPLTMDATTGVITPGGGICQSLIGGCAGLSPTTADIRHPSVSWKGDKVAFAARNSATEPFQIWTVGVDGTGCAKNDAIAAQPSSPGWTDNGTLVHNFDPVFTPDDRIVFASTRGNVMNTDAFDYKGPTRTPADPSRWNANLYILEGTAVRQLTFLLNQELYPSMMSDGRLIFSAEKRAPNFYQLAGRRMNLDGGDYHPLYAQRRTIGYAQMTEVVELADKNFAAIFGDQNAAHGAGTLAVFNRSVGPDQTSADPADYTADPKAINWPVSNFFLHSLRVLDSKATGHTGAGNTTGAYRSPAPLPNGQLIVSYAANVTDLTNFSGNFDLYLVDPVSFPLTGKKVQLTGDEGTDELSAVAVYQHFDRPVFQSRSDEPNGHTHVFAPGEDAEHPPNVADVSILDARILGSLLFQNTRTGLDNADDGRALPNLTSLDVYEDLPPGPNDTGMTPYTGMDAYGSFYARRRMLGTVPIFGDGSARMTVPGGLPLMYRGAFALDGGGVAEHFQRESTQFYPGEFVNQSFPQGFFNGMCGGCHGSVSGYETDLSIQPDILTQASGVQARSPGTRPVDLSGPPLSRGIEVGPVD
jgi:hypothetical protein